MLQSSVWPLAVGGHGARPLQTNEVQDQKLVEPVFTVASSEDEHLVVDDACCVELTHGRFASDNAGNVEAEFVHALLEVDENDIGEHLISIPTSVNDDLASVPHLAGVTHPWLRQLVLVDLWLSFGKGP